MAKERRLNPDPLTDEPGAHPVGTGLGAGGGALAGAAAGALAGPAGMAVGTVAGAVLGGLAGKAAAEGINPTVEHAYWRDTYTREPYYTAGRPYDDYAPAYELGWLGVSSYGGSFDDAQLRLAQDWEARRGGSSLSWPEAAPASRAAWERADRLRGAEAAQAVDGGDVVDTLNDLIETCRDGEYGFSACAEHSQAQNLKTFLWRRAGECRDAAAELETQVLRLGGKPEKGGSASGTLHRGWVAVRSTLSGYTDQAMLDECERGEDSALARYRKALKAPLPAPVRALVQRQFEGAQRNHDEVKALRDGLKTAP